MNRPGAIAVVGVGPRGLSVVERLLIRLRCCPAPVTIWAIDCVQPGAGRVWRTGQPGWFAMNATGGEVTAWSPDSPVSREDFVDWAAPPASRFRRRRSTTRRAASTAGI